MNGAVSHTHTYNVTCTDADTEYSQALPSFCSYFFIKCRQESSELKFSFVSEESGTVYTTIGAGSFYWEYGRFSGQKTLYFQSPQAGTVVEIRAQDS